MSPDFWEFEYETPIEEPIEPDEDDEEFQYFELAIQEECNGRYHTHRVVRQDAQ